MNHDITHCAGEGCTRRGKCHRYFAHLDLCDIRPVDLDSKPHSRSYTTWQACVDNGHNLYWPEDEEEPQGANKINTND